jgi:hypothetical protein
MWSNTAQAEEKPRFTFLGYNQCAPFEGTLFNPIATGALLSQAQTYQQQCEIKLKYELGLQSSEHKLQMQNLTIRHDALVAEYDMRVRSLERESDALATALKKQSKKNPVLWVAIGLAGGAALTYGAYRVFDDR